MSYTVFHKDTTRILRNHPGVKTDRRHFATEAAAKAALTRAVKDTASKLQPILREDFIVSSYENFRDVEKTEVVKNLMSGKDVIQSVNTELCLDPSSETYWCS
jgi:hypothetical protein